MVHINKSKKNTTAVLYEKDPRLTLNRENMVWLEHLYAPDYSLYAKHCAHARG